VTALTDLYLRTYPALMDAVWALRHAGRAVSDPLLMDPAAHGYVDSPRRLLVVGQETFGWGEDFQPGLEAAAGGVRLAASGERSQNGLA